MTAKTTHLKWEPEVKGQSKSLKVSSLPSLHFFFVIFLHGVVAMKKKAFFSMFKKKKTMTMRHRLLLWFCYKEKEGDDNYCHRFFVWWCCKKEKGDDNCCHHLLLCI